MISIKSTIKRLPILVLIGIVIQVGSALLLTVVLENLGLVEKYSSDMSAFNLSNPFVLLYTVILAPVFEELVFRFGIIKILKDIYRKLLKKQYNIWIIIIIQAALFGLYHGNLIQGIYAFLIGLLLGYLCEKWSVLDTIIIHGTINFLGIFLL